MLLSNTCCFHFCLVWFSHTVKELTCWERLVLTWTTMKISGKITFFFWLSVCCSIKLTRLCSYLVSLSALRMRSCLENLSNRNMIQISSFWINIHCVWDPSTLCQTHIIQWVQMLIIIHTRREQFSNAFRKTKTKVITLSNHNENKTQSEPNRNWSTHWNTYILLDGLVCSIVGYFYSSLVFWLALRARKNTARLIKISHDTTH